MLQQNKIILRLWNVNPRVVHEFLQNIMRWQKNVHTHPVEGIFFFVSKINCHNTKHDPPHFNERRVKKYTQQKSSLDAEWSRNVWPFSHHKTFLQKENFK